MVQNTAHPRHGRSRSSKTSGRTHPHKYGAGEGRPTARESSGPAAIRVYLMIFNQIEHGVSRRKDKIQRHVAPQCVVIINIKWYDIGVNVV